MKYIKNVSLYGNITDIGIENGRIASIEKTCEKGTDMNGLSVYPGLIDIHSHGCMGFDTMDKDDNLEKMSVFQLEHGTTSWYPTTMTMSTEEIIRATSRNIENLAGAQILGFHMEGPFINPKYKGAQNADFIFKPNAALLGHCKNVKIITMAPELPGSREFIENCDAVVSLGHSDADYETAKGAFLAGVRCLTHTFNAMPGIHHRKPGPILAAAETDNVYAQIIADGNHIHSSVLRMIIKLMGKERIILISDSMRATGMDDGEYDLGGQKIIVTHGFALTEDGHLAGSTSTLFDCVKHLVSLGVNAKDAVMMASENPAKLMGLNKGKIEIGYDADFIFTDENFNLVGTAVKGVLSK